jgi:septum formation protein
LSTLCVLESIEESLLHSKHKIVLASSSPRRKELLNKLGFEFKVCEPTIEEKSDNPDPRKRVIENAKTKALSLKDLQPNSLIIGADTIVYIDGLFLGKPNGINDARNMLGTLSGKTHQVFTGVAVLDTSSDRIFTGVDETLVIFKYLDPERIESYIHSGEPLDKAGSYAIQGLGRAFVKNISGSENNVIGLPLDLLENLLNKINEGN